MNIYELLRDGAASTMMLAELQGDSNHLRDAEKMEAAANEIYLQESSRSPSCYPVCCPHCGWDLQGVISLWYEAGCPPSGIGFNCKTCGKPVEVSPDTTFKVKAG